MKKRWNDIRTISVLQRTAVSGLAAALIVFSPLTAYAENFTGGDGWSVTFDGDSMNSTFKNTDIDDAIYQLQPGDTVDLHLALSNTYNGDTDWYMSNAVLQSLEDSQSVAEGGAYTYILTYIAPDGTSELLYSSEEVGGETINDSGEGLHQATDSLEDYFYLDRLSYGQAGEITLRVQLEGETQGNTYQDTLAKLQMNFAVELVPTTTTTTTTSRSVVKTGDQTRVMAYVFAMLAAGLVCLAAALFRFHKETAAETEGAVYGQSDRENRRRTVGKSSSARGRKRRHED